MVSGQNVSNDTPRAGGARTRALLCSTGLVLMMSGAALAQEVSEDGSTLLPEIVVEGAGSGVGDDDQKSIVARGTTGGGKLATPLLDEAASVSVITAEEFRRRNVQSTEEVLQYTAGAVTDFYGSDDRFDFFKIRGFDAWVYRDGLAIGAPFGGIREEPYAFERAEVLKGANSSSFGVSDPGGSVNYVTKTPRTERFGEAYLSGGSFRRGEVGFDFGDNITSDETLSYRLTGTFRKAHAEYDFSRDDNRFIMGGLTWRPTALTNLTVVYDHLSRDGVPGSGGHPVGTDFDRSRFFGEPDYNFRGVKRDTVSVMFDHDFDNGLTFASNARYSRSNTDFGYAYISATPTDGSTIASRSFFGNESSREHFIMDGRLQYDTSWESIDSRTIVGAEYSNDRTRNDSFFGAAPGIDWTNPVYTGAPASVPLFASTNGRKSGRALFVQQEFTFSEKLIASIGLRNDWLDLSSTNNLSGVTREADVSELTKRGALTYKITDQFSVYGSYAESVAPPSIGVEPERGHQREAGIKYQPWAFPALFTAAIYDLTKTNITRTNPATNLPETIGEVRVRGIELEAKAEVLDNFNLIAAYSYMMSEIVENGTAGNIGNQLSFVPNHSFSLWADYTLRGNGVRGDMTFGVGARYTGAYFFNDANTQSTGGNVVFDASFNYQLQENTALQMNVTNIFDTKHVAYGGFGADFYNPGRSVTATLRHTW